MDDNGKEKIEHNSRELRYRKPFGAVMAGSVVRLGLFVRLQEEVKEAWLRLWQDNRETLLPLSSDGEGFWSAETELKDPGLVWYYFRIVTPNRTIFYGNNEEQLGGVGTIRESEPPSFQITVFDREYRTPDWFKNSIVYQIFPDRFYRAAGKLPVKRKAVFHTDWSDTPYYYRDRSTGEVLAYDFFGGNLKGIEEKLSYLADLGVTAIYLNPIFEAESNHRYDTGDYHKIDPMLGTEEDFASLIEKAGKLGIRLILDGVFSHTGSNSRYFNKEGQYPDVGAFQSPQSPYHKWYKFKNYPEEYDSWWGVGNLPEVNEEEKSYQDFIINSKDSVLNFWQRKGIGGWRLDVVDELPESFLRSFYRQLKKLSPDNVLIGEVWEDASNKVSYGTLRNYLCGGELDSAMNYPLRSAMLGFVMGGLDARAAMRRIENLRENYPAENFYAMMNLLGTHDIERLLTVLGGGVLAENLPEVVRGGARLSPEARALAVKRLKLITLWQFTLPGAPAIYYGDEAGLEGQRDPFNRGAFPWESVDEEIFSWYKAVTRLRRKFPVLRTGKYIPLLAQGGVLAFARTPDSEGNDEFGRPLSKEAFVVVLNSGNQEAAVSIDTSALPFKYFRDYDLFGEGKNKAVTDFFKITVPPGSARLYQGVEAACPRGMGVLLHLSSLPSAYGIGDLGKNARSFVDFLAAGGQKVWQLLPLQPVDETGSPYCSPSAFAGNILLVDLEGLRDKGLLTDEELIAAQIPGDKVDFDEVRKKKEQALRQAFKRMDKKLAAEVAAYAKAERYWLEDYSLYRAAKLANDGRPWSEWGRPLRRREQPAIAFLKKRYREEILFTQFAQYVFAREWDELHRYAKGKGVRLFGDMPLFLAADSVDVWANREYFAVGEDGRATLVAGVPPDYFSETGQLWGNPQYDWERMEKDGFSWWNRRIKRQLDLVDVVRIDHFRGLEAYWEIKAGELTAQNGRWVKAPGEKLLRAVKQEFPSLPLVAEDLGIITDEVTALREKFSLPGMSVLQFELFSGELGFCPAENTVAYTGTHDNNTLMGWYRDELGEADRCRLREYLGVSDELAVGRGLIGRVLASFARLAVLPLQDVLLLSGENRLNTPGTKTGNWQWRLSELPDEKAAAYLAELCRKYNR